MADAGHARAASVAISFLLPASDLPARRRAHACRRRDATAYPRPATRTVGRAASARAGCDRDGPRHQVFIAAWSGSVGVPSGWSSPGPTGESRSVYNDRSGVAEHPLSSGAGLLGGGLMCSVSPSDDCAVKDGAIVACGRGACWCGPPVISEPGESPHVVGGVLSVTWSRLAGGVPVRGGERGFEATRTSAPAGHGPTPCRHVGCGGRDQLRRLCLRPDTFTAAQPVFTVIFKNIGDEKRS